MCCSKADGAPAGARVHDTLIPPHLSSESKCTDSVHLVELGLANLCFYFNCTLKKIKLGPSIESIVEGNNQKAGTSCFRGSMTRIAKGLVAAGVTSLQSCSQGEGIDLSDRLAPISISPWVRGYPDLQFTLSDPSETTQKGRRYIPWCDMSSNSKEDGHTTCVCYAPSTANHFTQCFLKSSARYVYGLLQAAKEFENGRICLHGNRTQ